MAQRARQVVRPEPPAYWRARRSRRRARRGPLPSRAAGGERHAWPRGRDQWHRRVQREPVGQSNGVMSIAWSLVTVDPLVSRSGTCMTKDQQRRRELLRLLWSEALYGLTRGSDPPLAQSSSTRSPADRPGSPMVPHSAWPRYHKRHRLGRVQSAPLSRETRRRHLGDAWLCAPATRGSRSILRYFCRVVVWMNSRYSPSHKKPHGR